MIFNRRGFMAHAHSPGDTTISIHAVGGLQYEVVRFKVKTTINITYFSRKSLKITCFLQSTMLML
jgi:hypothetical protein